LFQQNFKANKNLFLRLQQKCSDGSLKQKRKLQERKEFFTAYSAFHLFIVVSWRFEF